MFKETHSKILTKYQNKDELVLQLIEHPIIEQLPVKVIKTQKLQDALNKSQQLHQDSDQSSSVTNESFIEDSNHEFSRDIESAIDQALEVENLIEQVKTSLDRVNQLVSQIYNTQQLEKVDNFQKEMSKVQELRVYANEITRSITYVREEYERSQL